LASITIHSPLGIVFCGVLAAFWDYLVGDPPHWLHLVQVMGWFIEQISRRILQFCPHPWQRRLGGVGLGFILVLGSGGTGWLFLWVGDRYLPWLTPVLTIILLASCLAGRSLSQATESVLIPLQAGDLPQAREKLSYFVGRDTAQLNEAEILRATLESWAENSVDGVLAPWFYILLGLGIPVLGPVPLALAYKAASTLDSMVGYLREPYRDLGWFSAKLEDCLTWLPCRLTVLTLALISGKPRTVLSICRRDAPLDPSPNSGWSEAVYAAILGVQLGGENTYQGEKKWKPLLGNSDRPITSDVIHQARQLTCLCFWLWFALALIVVGYLQVKP
jgi:adenosylcobinamide-phosphate synthase